MTDLGHLQITEVIFVVVAYRKVAEIGYLIFFLINVINIDPRPKKMIP